MKLFLEKELNHPLIQMIRTYLRNDDQLKAEDYDNQLIWLSEVYKKEFGKYLNDEGTNDLQARELALNGLKKKILKQPSYQPS